MKKLIFALFAVLAVCVSSCSKYDDSDLWNSVNDLDKRVKALEELCKQMNTNITSIQTIINASKDGDYITSITPLTEGGKEIGYTITFSKSPSITIYHGKDGQNGANGSDGKDGITPNISVKMDTDGYYYWTLNGEWILDDSGEKILAQGINGNDGQSGRDGITPQLKIEDGGWYISYDNGQSWNYLGRATGESRDSMFKNIDTSNPDYVIFTLADGTEFKVDRHDELSINFDSEDLITMEPNSTRTIKYTISGATGNLKVEVLSSGNVRAKISDNTSATGTVTVTAGATIDEYDKVIMLASDGKTTVMSSLYFEEGYLRVTNSTSYQLDAQRTTLSINIETNTEYTLSIPDDAKNWISIVASRAARQETITLNIAANEGAARTATLALLGIGGQSLCDIQISQSGEKDCTIPSDMSIAFPDPEFRKVVLTIYDSNRDGMISQKEAGYVTQIDLSSYHNNANKISSLEGIQYFPNLTHLICRGLWLTYLDISKNTLLTELDCRINQLTTLDVSKNTALTRLECDENQLTTLDLSKNTALTLLVCYKNKLTSLDVTNNTSLISLYCENNQLTTLDVSKNTALISLDCGYNQLTTLDMSKNTALIYLHCRSNQLTTLDVSKNTALTRLDCSENQLTTLDVSKTNIGSDSHLFCANMSSLKTLYLKTGWSINGITKNRSTSYIPEQTEIVFVD